MFKIGDKVKVIKRGSSYASSKYFGSVGVVVKSKQRLLDSSSYCCLDIEGSDPDGFWNEELELIKEPEWD